MCDARRGSRTLQMVAVNAVPLKMLPLGTVTDMGIGGDRRELNDDQKDRRPNYPQKCSGRIHAQ